MENPTHRFEMIIDGTTLKGKVAVNPTDPMKSLFELTNTSVDSDVEAFTAANTVIKVLLAQFKACPHIEKILMNKIP